MLRPAVGRIKEEFIDPTDKRPAHGDLPPIPAGVIAQPAAASRMRRVLARAGEPQVIFPVIAVVVLAIIWGATLHLIRTERGSAVRAVETSVLELLDTYEAQMLRNLREIDHALKLVAYAHESSPRPGLLAALRLSGLLPPELLFTVSLQPAHGRPTAGARPALHDPPLISAPRRGADGEVKLDFSRALASGRGNVTLSVDAAYFVSGYERGKLGDAGILGLADQRSGDYLVRRSGDVVSTGSQSLVPVPQEGDFELPKVVRVPAAGNHEFMASVRPLYGFPVALTVALATQEQFVAVEERSRAYVWRAVVASVMVLVFLGALGRVSWKLTQTARRESDAKIAHAERIQYLAYRDGLTGLPNRLYFSQMLERGLSHARRHGRTLAVLFLDLDRFKQINDTLGHDTGDRLLQEVAARLTSCLRESDTVARLGGDEFVVLLPEFDDEMYVGTVAQKLLAEVSRPLALLGHQLIGTTSIGIAVFPRDGADEQTLMKYADAAMYHAKDQGKNNFQFYSASLQVTSLRRLKLESELRQAMQRKELHLQYQPKVSLTTGRITGMEALLRWNSAAHGLVSPVDFIPIAEDTGLIVDMGRWALREACTQNMSWQTLGLPPVRMAVNLSARQFNDQHLLDDVQQILRETGLAPSLLELEITESMIMNNVDNAVRILQSLSGLGISLAIDDFGTGYSSLSNLKRFPLHTLKVDRSFVKSLPEDAEDRVITRAIISMGKALSLSLVAEGVETEAQAEFLRGEGCDEMQGFLYSKPLVAAQLEKLLEAECDFQRRTTPVVARSR